MSGGDGLIIRAAERRDLPALTALYNHYVEHTVITFDLEPWTVQQRAEWFGHYAETGPHRLLVGERDGRLVGYAGSSISDPRRVRPLGGDVGLPRHDARSDEATAPGSTARCWPCWRPRRCTARTRVWRCPTTPRSACTDGWGSSRSGSSARSGYKFGRYVDVEWFELGLPL